VEGREIFKGVRNAINEMKKVVKKWEYG